MFLIDMAGADDRDPREDYATLLAELKAYDPKLLKKPRLVVANKVDLPEAKKNLTAFKKKHKVDILKISCLTGEGLEELKQAIRARVIKHGGKPRVMPRPRALA
jgi:GTP-binding protein